LKRLDLIDGALRAPEPGAPFAYVTTKKFLEVFGLATLRDLPDIERLEDEGLLQRPQSDIDIDDALGLVEADGEIFEREDTTDDA
jgi:segregation and condensation protein B